jgi:hypothetical protein
MNTLRNTKTWLATAAVALLAVGVMPMDAKNTSTRLKAKLTGAPISGQTPSGEAEFRTDLTKLRSSLDVEVEHVNLPAATVLTVSFIHAGKTTAIGTIKLSKSGEGELELSTEDGDQVPAIVTGDMITVANGVTPILAGLF